MCLYYCTVALFGTKVRSSYVHATPKHGRECVKQIHITRTLYASHAWVHDFPQLQRSEFD